MAYIPYNIYKGDYKTEFKLIAYEKENGEIPVEEFLDSVNPKMRAKYFDCWVYYKKRKISYSKNSPVL